MPSDPRTELIAEFEKSRERYEEFSAKLEGLLSTLLRRAEIRFDAIQQRVKSKESLFEKLDRAGKSYTTLAGVPDLCGLRIVVYHKEDLDRVVEVIEREFDVDGEVSGDAAAKLAPHEFGYLSVHLIVRLSEARRQLPEWNSVADVHAEIQVRTVLQHAWASISHSLQYKHEVDVPGALRRRLNRVAALLELADQEFMTLSAEHRELRRSRDPETANIQMILRRALRGSAHSYDWIRSNTPLNYADSEFDKVISDNPDVFEYVRVIQRDEKGDRIVPGKPGIRLKDSAKSAK